MCVCVTFRMLCMAFSSVTGFGAYFQWNFKVVYLISNCCIGTVWYTVF